MTALPVLFMSSALSLAANTAQSASDQEADTGAGQGFDAALAAQRDGDHSAASTAPPADPPPDQGETTAAPGGVAPGTANAGLSPWGDLLVRAAGSTGASPAIAVGAGAAPPEAADRSAASLVEPGVSADAATVAITAAPSTSPPAPSFSPPSDSLTTTGAILAPAAPLRAVGVNANSGAAPVTTEPAVGSSGPGLTDWATPGASIAGLSPRVAVAKSNALPVASTAGATGPQILAGVAASSRARTDFSLPKAAVARDGAPAQAAGAITSPPLAGPAPHRREAPIDRYSGSGATTSDNGTPATASGEAVAPSNAAAADSNAAQISAAGMVAWAAPSSVPGTSLNGMSLNRSSSNAAASNAAEVDASSSWANRRSLVTDAPAPIDEAAPSSAPEPLLAAAVTAGETVARPMAAVTTDAATASDSATLTLSALSGSSATTPAQGTDQPGNMSDFGISALQSSWSEAVLGLQSGGAAGRVSPPLTTAPDSARIKVSVGAQRAYLPPVAVSGAPAGDRAWRMIGDAASTSAQPASDQTMAAAPFELKAGNPAPRDRHVAADANILSTAPAAAAESASLIEASAASLSGPVAVGAPAVAGASPKPVETGGAAPGVFSAKDPAPGAVLRRDLDVALEPADLGGLAVRLKSRGDRLEIAFVAQRDDTARLIDSAGGRLALQLRDAGLGSGGLEVSVSSGLLPGVSVAAPQPASSGDLSGGGAFSSPSQQGGAFSGQGPRQNASDGAYRGQANDSGEQAGNSSASPGDRGLYL